MKIKHRFFYANLIALFYAGTCFFLAQDWVGDLNATLGNYLISLSIIFFIAIIPGYLNILLLTSLFFYKYEPVQMKNDDFPPVTLIIPAYNEEDTIKETFRGIKQQNYPNIMEIIFVDDGSTDNTVKKLENFKIDNLKIIRAKHGGKASALNIGLKESSNEIILTIDADTFLHRNAVKRIVARIESDEKYAAVAGHVLVKNERFSRLSRIQTWDYMLGISAVKRQQAMFEGTLVAQGAFSAYRKKAIMSVEGWKERLGEDIVLTWAFLKKRYKVGYEPTAFAFTNAPLDYKHFLSQRQRWARGMIEGFKDHIDLIWKNRNYSSFFVAIDLLFPLIDFYYTFVFIPGVILALFGHFYIVGPITLFVIPISICIIIAMLISQKRFMKYAGLKIRLNNAGMIFYALFFQFLMSPICLVGYFKELLPYKKRW